jgi:HlyD family secretion protein
MFASLQQRLIGIVFGLMLAPLAASAQDEQVFQKVERGPVTQTVVERGELRAANAVDIVCKVRNRGDGKVATTIRWVIDDGAMVKKGDKIVELDSGAIQDQVRAMEIAVAQAQARLVQADSDRKTIESLNRSEIQAAELGIEIAAAEAKHAVSVSALEKRQMEVRIRRAKLGAEAAKEQAAATGEAIHKKMAEMAECEVEIAELELKKLTDRDDVQKKRTDLQTLMARRGVETAKLQSSGRTTKAEADLAATKAAFEAERARLETAKEELAACTMAAPADGLAVYYVSEQSRSGFGSAQSVIAQGEPVREGQRLIQIVDLMRLQAATRVHEISVRYVRTGQLAALTVDALPNKSILGKVSSVASVAMQPDWRASPDVKLYQTVVDIDKAVEGLKPGMTADVMIVIAQKKDVVRIPVSALVLEKSQPYCHIKTKDGTEKRSIRTGARNDQHIEILEGLKEGEEVLVNPRILLRGIGALGRRSTVIVESIKPTDDSSLSAGRRSFIESYGLTKKDLDVIQMIQGVAAVVPERRFPQEMRRQGQMFNGRVVGTTAALVEQQSLKLASGRFLATIDGAEFKNVAVLGASVSDRLFPSEDPIGQTVTMSGHRYVVIGVLAKQPIYTLRNDEVIVPLSTVDARFGESVIIRTSGSLKAEKVAIHRLTITTDDPDRTPVIRAAIGLILSERHENKDWAFMVR